MTRVRRRSRIALALLPLAGIVVPASGATAAEARVAVAANFAEVLETLQTAFQKDTAHTLATVTGSTGKLYSQIVNGAPFDVLLAADQARPTRLEAEGRAVSGSRFTYAVGRLALWSRDPGLVPRDGRTLLRGGDFRRLAIANPRLAPYGRAAREALEALGVWSDLRPRIVQGQNIGQTFALVASGNAELGLVALSYVRSPRNEVKGSRWEVPARLHRPVRQDAVLLTHGADNPAARAFLAYLRSAPARSAIARFGYATRL